MRKQIIAVLGILVLLVTAMSVGAFVTRADAADGYSQDPDAPTLVDKVPQGFRPIGRPQVTEDNCVQTLRQIYSRTTDPVMAERQRTYVAETTKGEERSARKEYTPGTDAQDEVSHLVYSYKQPKFKTQYKGKWQKYVAGDVYEKKQGTDPKVGTFPYEVWDSPLWDSGPSFQQDNSWQNSPPAFIHSSGGHNNESDDYQSGGKTYYKKSTSYQYQLISTQTQQVADGFEFSGEVTEQRQAPWMLLPGYPKKVVDSEAVPATPGSWSGWLPGALDFLDDWTGDEPVTPGVLVGSADQPDVYWNQTRTVIDEAAHWGPWSSPDNEGWVYIVGPIEQPVPGDVEKQERVEVAGFMEFVYTVTTDGEPCERPTGHRDRDVSEKCVDGDVVRTTTVSGASPVQAEDGSWFLAPYAHSEQRVVGEDDCAPVVFRKPPEKQQQVLPNTGASDHLGLLAALSAALVVSGGVAMAASRRRA
jgi:hypothetical protein